jgi:hypothetical protein
MHSRLLKRKALYNKTIFFTLTGWQGQASNPLAKGKITMCLNFVLLARTQLEKSQGVEKYGEI